MTAKQFAEKHTRQLRTVRGWIKNGKIPGAHDDFVPDSAREPYNARAKEGYQLLKSMMKACAAGKGITPNVYGISPEMFQACIDSLIHEGMIYSYEEDGIMYYNITVNGLEKLNSFKPAQWITLASLICQWFPVLIQLLGVNVT